MQPLWIFHSYLPSSSSIDGQDSNSPSFDWFDVADQSQRFSYSSLEREVSGLTQTQQAGQHALLQVTVSRQRSEHDNNLMVVGWGAGFVKLKHNNNNNNLDGRSSGLRELQQMEAELLHSSSEELNITNSLKPFDQSSGPVVNTHPGCYLHNKKTHSVNNI